MIIQGSQKPDLLLPDMTFWTMTINQPTKEIYKNYKVLCPPILYAEIYNDVSGANKRLKKPLEVLSIDAWQILVKNELQGRPEIQNGNIGLMNLKSESDMSEAEKDVVESAKALVEVFDKEDRLYCLRFFRPLPKGRLCYNTISIERSIRWRNEENSPLSLRPNLFSKLSAVAVPKQKCVGTIISTKINSHSGSDTSLKMRPYCLSLRISNLTMPRSVSPTLSSSLGEWRSP